MRFNLWKVLSMSCLAMCIILLVSRQPEEIECPDPSNPYIFQEKIIRQEARLFDVQEGALQALHIPYKYLLGSPPKSKRFLTIGISSVKRAKGDYLLTTLESIFSHCSHSELEELIVVVYLANFKHSVNTAIAEEIKKHYSLEVSAGRLLVISSYSNAYPPLEGLKRNYKDPPERVTFRSKQNVDYAFLVNVCANLSQYYLMLEDDVSCAKNFLTSIKTYVQEYGPPWTTITFSNLGYIGKLYHNEDLSRLARFLLLFYDEMPCDWLLDLFYKSKAQGDIIRYKPSLFQHMGVFSSFKSNQNKLKDKDFMEITEHYGDHPLASCLSNMKVYQGYGPDNVCFASPNFFWGAEITEKSQFTMIFQVSITIERINIITGTSDHPSDILKSGYVELGRDKVQQDQKVSCKSFTKIGNFHNGTFFLDNISKAAGEAIDCLRIQASEPQTEWLIIQKIGIWVRKEKTHHNNSSDIVSVAR
ncbi:alpha-1,3-mannosyl-glycoprotein 4-beta-N-acetylglucosaminyltransferase C-like [Hyperolius riggenbachi]|uniref:alpha-1,3-mannosyl-glycoprotein 4-beta-N-acetylglucosaminyltransferase C-like n=1 Tax=Hyperolius riggenbachi TaxID=752182 RepID=UPI0035A33A78